MEWMYQPNNVIDLFCITLITKSRLSLRIFLCVFLLSHFVCLSYRKFFLFITFHLLFLSYVFLSRFFALAHRPFDATEKYWCSIQNQIIWRRTLWAVVKVQKNNNFSFFCSKSFSPISFSLHFNSNITFLIFSKEKILLFRLIKLCRTTKEKKIRRNFGRF